MERSQTMVYARIAAILLLYTYICHALSLKSRRAVLVSSAASLWIPSVAEAGSKISEDPLKVIPIPGNRKLKLPKVGYSLYKTPLDQVEEGVRIALEAGVQSFDCATAYGSNEIVAQAIQKYANRQRTFITHKLSNEEQSMDKVSVTKAVLKQLDLFKRSKLDLVMIHSPLTDTSRRLATYEALLELQTKGRIAAVGVCHFGVESLDELVQRFPAPSVIQQVLSPFNQRKKIKEWVDRNGSCLACSAWSRLSSTDGPQNGWTVIADLAKAKGMTKQQVLIRWAVQSGYLCFPRSSAKYKVEKDTIVENSWAKTKDFVLSDEEMAIINSLDEEYPTGKLGIVDGWDSTAIQGGTWDPTLL